MTIVGCHVNFIIFALWDLTREHTWFWVWPRKVHDCPSLGVGDDVAIARCNIQSHSMFADRFWVMAQESERELVLYSTLCNRYVMKRCTKRAYHHCVFTRVIFCKDVRSLSSLQVKYLRTALKISRASKNRGTRACARWKHNGRQP